MVQELNPRSNASRPSRQHNRRSSTHKNSTVEIFNCACGKTYNSFPALYLHNKLKHGLTIRAKQKAKMMKERFGAERTRKSFTSLVMMMNTNNSKLTQIAVKKWSWDPKSENHPKGKEKRRYPSSGMKKLPLKIWWICFFLKDKNPLKVKPLYGWKKSWNNFKTASTNTIKKFLALQKFLRTIVGRTVLRWSLTVSISLWPNIYCWMNLLTFHLKKIPWTFS